MAVLLLRPERLDTAAPTLATLLTPSRTDTAVTRLRVYADGYPARIQEVLAETFPAVAHVIGAAGLAGLTQRYIRTVTLRSYNINGAGAALPRVLGNDPLSQRLPFLPDLAELEWRIAVAFHARQHPPVDPAPLATWTLAEWKRVVLRFQPSVAIVCSRWPIRSIWECRETPIEQIDLDLRDRPQRVLVYRSGFQVHCELVDPQEAAVLANLLAGRSLGEVTRRLANAGDGGAVPAAAFARWMRAGIIVGCSLSPRTRAGARRRGQSARQRSAY